LKGKREVVAPISALRENAIACSDSSARLASDRGEAQKEKDVCFCDMGSSEICRYNAEKFKPDGIAPRGLMRCIGEARIPAGADVDLGTPRQCMVDLQSL